MRLSRVVPKSAWACELIYGWVEGYYAVEGKIESFVVGGTSSATQANRREKALDEFLISMLRATPWWIGGHLRFGLRAFSKLSCDDMEKRRIAAEELEATGIAVELLGQEQKLSSEELSEALCFQMIGKLRRDKIDEAREVEARLVEAGLAKELPSALYNAYQQASRELESA